MKKLLFALACATAGMASAQTVINGNNFSDGTLQMMLVNSSMTAVEKTDTLVVKDGKFTYEYKGDKAAMAMLNTGTGRIQFFLVPGENGTITSTGKGFKWSGSQFYTELAKFEEATDPIEEKMGEISSNFQKQVQAGANRDSLQQAIMPQYEALNKQLAEAQLNYIKANPKSNVSATLVSQVEDMEGAMALIAPEVKTGVFAPLFETLQARIDKEKARKEAAKLVAEGCVAPDFTLKDINGNDLALSSLRGKYVILDFWGSWCGWCIKGFPDMKEYYKKYAGKFEILGVDCNDTEDKWKAAVAKNELPWKHVYCPRTSDITTKYAIEGFPTKIVIDPQGKIAKTIIGEDPAFYTYLDELFK